MSEAKKKFSIIEVEHAFIEVEHQFTKRINIKVQNKSEALGDKEEIQEIRDQLKN